MNKSAVSPKYTVEKLINGSLKDRIDVLEDQVEGWILNHAKALASDQYNFHQHSGLAILMLTVSYFEPIACYLAGCGSDNKSKEFFKSGFMEVFEDTASSITLAGIKDPESVIQKMVDAFYDEIRCGLFHEAMIRGRVIIRRDTAPLGWMIEQSTGKVGAIVIDPIRFLGTVEAHFKNYIQRLRDPDESELRSNFEKFWSLRMGRTGAVPPPPSIEN